MAAGRLYGEQDPIPAHEPPLAASPNVRSFEGTALSITRGVRSRRFRNGCSGGHGSAPDGFHRVTHVRPPVRNSGRGQSGTRRRPNARRPGAHRVRAPRKEPPKKTFFGANASRCALEEGAHVPRCRITPPPAFPFQMHPAKQPVKQAPVPPMANCG